MAIKKTVKKVKKIPTISQNVNKESSSHGKIGIILFFILLIINILLSVSILLTNSNTFDNSKINNMETKINAIDNFFRENVREYNTGSNTTGNSNSHSVKTDISADDDPFIGNANAKVTIIEFSDYQCPFCRKFWTESYSQLKVDYIDTGKIKYVFRDFPLGFHKGAIPAAIAGNCVREQLGNEGYFKYHDIVFTEQNKITQNTVNLDEKMILDFVSKVGGIDMTKFNTCFNDPSQKTEVEADLTAGAKAGVSGTPSFFINGKLLVGAQPYSVIKSEIEKALNN